MARENFLWGAPRNHGELLMLGFTVSQATVSRYMPARSRQPTHDRGVTLRAATLSGGPRERHITVLGPLSRSDVYRKRSRDHKNDQAWVEQKNGAAVRRVGVCSLTLSPVLERDP